MSDEQTSREKEVQNIQQPPIRPSRRSPTTGHRRRKQDVKRSHSSPREKTEFNSEEEINEEVVIPLEEKSKKVIKRRVKVKVDKDEISKENEYLEEKTDVKVIEQDPIKPEELPEEEKLLKETTPTPDEPVNSQSWWSTWIPSWTKKQEKRNEENVNNTEHDQVDDDELSSEFAALVTQAERKILAEIEDQQLVADIKNEEEVEPEEQDLPPPPAVKTWSQFIIEIKLKYKSYKEEYPQEVETLKKLRNRCISELVIIMIFCGLGAFVFKFVEGAFESFYKCGVKRVKRDFIDELWRGSHNLREDEWKSKARRKLMDFENQLHEAFEAGMTTYSGRRSWSFINAVVYCLTVVTTIGYGHIAPVTTTGRALTIAYSIIGIPLFLILLADFGKLFTRGIKFLWAFVRRVYYTGSCRKVRRTAPVQEVMKGVQLVYDMALLRRPSQMPSGTDPSQAPPMTPISPGGDAPSTPALSAYAVDDEFNLPISVAIFVLLVYIFMGAAVFYIWETDWTFFDSFYFVFISMSTIGFGDLVPANQMYMMASIVYLAFGLALTSMCINVVQEKLSDTFRQASAKIGATIGLKVCEDDGTVEPASPTHVEIAEIHKSPLPPT